MLSRAIVLAAGVAVAGCGAAAAQTASVAPVTTQPTAAQAITFVDSAENVIRDLSIAAERASWVQANFITHDTELLAAAAEERLITATVQLATAAARFNDVDLPAETERKLKLLKLSLSNPAPSDPAKTKELTRIGARMESTYGAGKYCRADGTCFNLEQLSDTLAYSRNPASLEEAWVGWHSIARPMRADYKRFAELANEGARELGFADLGAMWRSNYDMPPDEFAQEVDRLWGQV